MNRKTETHASLLLSVFSGRGKTQTRCAALKEGGDESDD